MMVECGGFEGLKFGRRLAGFLVVDCGLNLSEFGLLMAVLGWWVRAD